MLEVYGIGLLVCYLGTYVISGYKGYEVDFFENLGQCFVWPLILAGELAAYAGYLIKEYRK